VIVSRGRAHRDGDGFRIPEIMAQSGALLREVGTTNRTKIADYENAINEKNTAAAPRASFEFHGHRLHGQTLARGPGGAEPATDCHSWKILVPVAWWTYRARIH